MTSNNINNIELLNIIGKGAFGNVYLGKDKTTKEYFAVKLISKVSLKKSQSIEYFKNEVSILKKINHPNIIKFRGLLENEDYYYLLTEYCNGGTLYRAMRFYNKNYSKPIKEKIVRYFIFNILNGIIHLNKNNIIHRDIKSDNILLHYDNEQDLITNNYLKAKVKIIDFGFARFLKKNELAGSLVGTPMYMEPLILNSLLVYKKKKIDGFYNEKVDVWSLGILTYELLIGILPFVAESIEELLLSIQNRDFVIPKENKRNFELSKNALNFIDKCLNVDVNLRPLPIDLINDEWMKNSNNEEENEINSDIYEMKNDEEIMEQEQDYKFFSYWKKCFGKNILTIKNISYLNPNKKKFDNTLYQTDRIPFNSNNRIINITTCPIYNIKLGNSTTFSKTTCLTTLHKRIKVSDFLNKGIINFNVDLKHSNNKIYTIRRGKRNSSKNMKGIVNIKKNVKLVKTEKKDKTEVNFFESYSSKSNLSINYFRNRKNKNNVKSNILMYSTQVNKEKILNNNKYTSLFKDKTVNVKNFQKTCKIGRYSKYTVPVPNSVSIDLYHRTISNTGHNRNNNRNRIRKNLKEYIKNNKKTNRNSSRSKTNKNTNLFISESNNCQKSNICKYKNHVLKSEDQLFALHKIGKSCTLEINLKTNKNIINNNKKKTYSNKTFYEKKNNLFGVKYHKINNLEIKIEKIK